jgi:hypothetical protein|tara:strand:+ start:4175 stop:4645 length:471 start_codon:yes stop_codon:yes gene_type:complete
MKFDVRRGKGGLRSRKRGKRNLKSKNKGEVSRPVQRRSLASSKLKFFKNEGNFLLPGSSRPSRSLDPNLSKKARRRLNNLRSSLFTKLRFRLRKKTVKGRLIRKFKKLRRRLSIRKATFSYPMTKLGKQLLYVDLNKVLVTKFYKKKDVIIPYSIH